jgi:hypothetical protein
VEEKNGSIVRRLVGYDRYEGADAWRALTALYRWVRLYVNYFQPSMKLLSRERLAGHITKHYDRAQTPCQRALESSAVSEQQKNTLRDIYAQLDPVLLLKNVEALQDKFWSYAYRKPNVSTASSASQWAVTVLHDIAPVIRENVPPQQNPTRLYRRTRKPGVPHTWRTRIDPFADVWNQLQLPLDMDPSRSAKELFLELQIRYPGRFPDGQLRTLQRRVQQRRRELLYIA